MMQYVNQEKIFQHLRVFQNSSPISRIENEICLFIEFAHARYEKNSSTNSRLTETITCLRDILKQFNEKIVKIEGHILYLRQLDNPKKLGDVEQKISLLVQEIVQSKEASLKLSLIDDRSFANMIKLKDQLDQTQKEFSHLKKLQAEQASRLTSGFNLLRTLMQKRSFYQRCLAKKQVVLVRYENLEFIQEQKQYFATLYQETDRYQGQSVWDREMVYEFSLVHELSTDLQLKNHTLLVQKPPRLVQFDARGEMTVLYENAEIMFILEKLALTHLFNEPLAEQEVRNVKKHIRFKKLRELDEYIVLANGQLHTHAILFMQRVIDALSMKQDQVSEMLESRKHLAQYIKKYQDQLNEVLYQPGTRDELVGIHLEMDIESMIIQLESLKHLSQHPEECEIEIAELITELNQLKNERINYEDSLLERMISLKIVPITVVENIDIIHWSNDFPYMFNVLQNQSMLKMLSSSQLKAIANQNSHAGVCQSAGDALTQIIQAELTKRQQTHKHLKNEGKGSELTLFAKPPSQLDTMPASCNFNKQKNRCCS